MRTSEEATGRVRRMFSWRSGVAVIGVAMLAVGALATAASAAPSSSGGGQRPAAQAPSTVLTNNGSPTARTLLKGKVEARTAVRAAVTVSQLVDLATNRCLDSNASGSVYTLPCNGGNYQYWYWSGNRLVDYATGRCLDSNSSGSVYTLPCNGGNYQNWIPTTYDWTLHDAQTGRCLDSNASGSVYTLGCNGGDYQEWIRGIV